MTVVRRVLANTARFILCAVPGAFMILILLPVLLLAGFAPPWARPIEVAAVIAMVPIGAALILYGTNNWGKWGYTLPVIAVLPWLLAPIHTPTAVRLALLMLPFVVAWGVRKYYRRRADVQHPESPKTVSSYLSQETTEPFPTRPPTERRNPRRT